MKDDYEKEYEKIERDHPWFIARRKLFRSLLPTEKKLSILDFGCGSGFFLEELSKYGYEKIEGVEISENFNHGKTRNHENFKITNKIKNKKYDIILLMDVLEHIEDDKSFLLSMHNHLNERGRIIASVPSYNCLWSNHDVINMHFRRYNRESFRKLINDSNFTINFMSNWNMTVLPFIALSRLLNKNSNNELRINNKYLSYFLYIILLTENIIFKTTGLPLGLSIISSFR